MACLKCNGRGVIYLWSPSRTRELPCPECSPMRIEQVLLHIQDWLIKNYDCDSTATSVGVEFLFPGEAIEIVQGGLVKRMTIAELAREIMR